MILEHLYVTHRHVEIHVNSYNSFQHELKKKWRLLFAKIVNTFLASRDLRCSSDRFMKKIQPHKSIEFFMF